MDGEMVHPPTHTLSSSEQSSDLQLAMKRNEGGKGICYQQLVDYASDGEVEVEIDRNDLCSTKRAFALAKVIHLAFALRFRGFTICSCSCCCASMLCDIHHAQYASFAKAVATLLRYHCILNDIYEE